MPHQVCRAVDPRIRITDVMEDRSSIAAGLAGPTRKRRPRTERYRWKCATHENRTETS